jgi:hypothetical protein
MHYFKTLGLALDPEDIKEYHIGRESPTKNWLDKPRADGKVVVNLFRKNGKESTITTGNLNAEDLAKFYNETVKELEEFFCEKQLKIAKEDPTETVLNAEPVEKTII